MEKCLQWNDSKWHGHYVLDTETLNLFHRELGGIDCQRDINNFFILLGDPLAMIDNFFEALRPEILILALDFFMCDALMRDLCHLIKFRLDQHR